MTPEEQYFQDMHKRRQAETIVPPNAIKEKVGNGGIEPRLIEKAEKIIEENKTDFQPIGHSYLDILNESIEKISNGDLKNDEAFESIFYPLVQLKAQGSMFKHPVITEIAAMLINFLEVIEDLEDDALSIIIAHKMTLKAILDKKVDGRAPETEEARALIGALRDACLRYFQSKK